MCWLMVALFPLTLLACKKPADATAPSPSAPAITHHGRFVGIGIYQPGEPWTKLLAAQRPKPVGVARMADDQAIFVVVDSDTGEVRSCGDMSGFCIGMNPWAKPRGATQIAPISLIGRPH